MRLAWRPCVFIFLLGLLLILSGCWSRREVNDLAIVTGVGMDLERDGQIHLTIQIAKPGVLAKGRSQSGGGKSGGKAYWLLEGRGLTVVDAVRNFNTMSPRQLFFAHTPLVIFGEDLARQGLGPTLDRLSRTKDLRRTAWVMVAKGRAREILEAELEPDELPAFAIDHMVETRGAASKGYGIDFKDFLRLMTSPTDNAVASRIELRKELTNREAWEPGGDRQEMGNGQDDNNALGQIPEESGLQSGEQAKKSVLLRGAAVFKRDKMVGWFTPLEVRGLLWVQGKVRRGIIVIDSPLSPGEKLAFESIRSQSKIIPEIHRGKVRIKVKISEENDLAEDLGFTRLTPESIPEVEKKVSAAIRQEVLTAVRKSQKEFKSDVFGFGTAVHRKYPKQWKTLATKWAEIYPDLEVQVEVKSEVRRRGMTTEPPKPGGEGKEEEKR